MDVLTNKARELFPKLSEFKDGFYLAGGTGLALQIHHRISVDFDLFSDSPIKKTLLKKVENVFATEPREIFTNNANELTLLVGEVKLTFLNYPFPVILPLHIAPPISILAAKEILAAKAYTVGRRGELKDYIDLYIGLKTGVSSLVEIIELARKKYGDAFNDRLFLEQLTYTDDIDTVPIVMATGDTPTKTELTEFFSKSIKDAALL